MSSAALPTPPAEYGGLESVMAWCAEEFAKAGHDVTLISAKGSPWAGQSPHPKLQVLETIPPAWDADAELNHHLAYRDLIHQEYTDGKSIVLDSTWFDFNYLIQQSFPNMKHIHVHHGACNWQRPPPVRWPRMLGVSRPHALSLSNQLNIPCRHVHNGIPIPPDSEISTTKGDYLLSLNRISSAKGIHDAIDVAMATRTPIKVIGDDCFVEEHQYVRQIIDRCDDSGGLAEYYGLVDNETKKEMLKNCMAVIACPKPSYVEAFGMYAVEALSYGRPVLCTKNGGLLDIVQHNLNGYLAGTPEELKEYVGEITNIRAADCRARAMEFSKEKMSQKYLELFTKVLEEGERW